MDVISTMHDYAWCVCVLVINNYATMHACVWCVCVCVCVS